MYITLIVLVIVATLLGARRLGDGAITMDQIYYDRFKKAIYMGEHVEASIYYQGDVITVSGDELEYVTAENLVSFKILNKHI